MIFTLMSLFCFLWITSTSCQQTPLTTEASPDAADDDTTTKPTRSTSGFRTASRPARTTRKGGFRTATTATKAGAASTARAGSAGSAASAASAESILNSTFCSKGQLQSPIMLEERPPRFTFQFSLFFRDYFVDDFVFINFWLAHEAIFNYQNNRYELRFDSLDEERRPAITNGTLGLDIYFLEKITFHWNPVEGTATEHLLRWVSYDGEMQMLTFNSKYKTFQNALEFESDGLAAFAIFIKSSNMAYGKTGFVDFFVRLTDMTKVYELPFIFHRTIPKAFLPEETEEYIMYQGSLTSEPCTEVVKWVLFNTPVRVPPFLLSVLRNTFPGNATSQRNIQPLNRRKFYYRYEDFDSKVYDPIEEEVLHRIPSLFDNLTKDFVHLAGENSIPYCFKSEEHCAYPASNWEEVYPKCGAKLQSPINIDLSQLKQQKINNFYPIYNKVKSGKTSLPVPRDDKTIYIHFPKDKEKWEVVNKLNNEKYILDRIKIVIGVGNGSEHSVNNTFYPIELQFINVNDKFESVLAAQDKKDGILIICKFFEFSGENRSPGSDHKQFQKLIPSLAESIRYFNGLRLLKRHFTKEILIEGDLQINELLGPPSDIFIYNGSLSEPPCSGQVMWFIKRMPGLITEEDYMKILEKSEEFKLLVGEISGLNEKRPIQPIRGRPISIVSLTPDEEVRSDSKMIQGAVRGRTQSEQKRTIHLDSTERTEVEKILAPNLAVCKTSKMIISFLSFFVTLLKL